MKSPAKPYQRPTDGVASGEQQSASRRQPPPPPLPEPGQARHRRGTMPQAVLQLSVATSTLPRYHSRQLPLHELPHALVLGRIREEEAESPEVSGGVGEQAPHG